MNKIRCMVGKTTEINFCKAYNLIAPESLPFPEVKTSCMNSKCQAKTDDDTGNPVDFIHLIPSLDVPEEEILSDAEIMIRCQCSKCKAVFAKSLFSYFNDEDKKESYYKKNGLDYKEPIPAHFHNFCID